MPNFKTQELRLEQEMRTLADQLSPPTIQPNLGKQRLAEIKKGKIDAELKRIGEELKLTEAKKLEEFKVTTIESKLAAAKAESEAAEAAAEAESKLVREQEADTLIQARARGFLDRSKVRKMRNAKAATAEARLADAAADQTNILTLEKKFQEAKDKARLAAEEQAALRLKEQTNLGKQAAAARAEDAAAAKAKAARAEAEAAEAAKEK